MPAGRIGWGGGGGKGGRGRGRGGGGGGARAGRGVKGGRGWGREDGGEESRGGRAGALVSRGRALGPLGSARRSLPLFDHAVALRRTLLARGPRDDVAGELARDRVVRAEVLLE